MDPIVWLVGVAAIVFSVWGIVIFINRFYIKVPPNQVAVLYGRKNRTKDGVIKGFRMITGGGAIRIPIVEDITFIDLNVIPIDLEVQGTPNKDGVLIDVQAVANVKILSDKTSLAAACERFLTMSPEEIEEVAYKNLEGHLRSIIGRLTVEEIVSDRQKFNQEVLQEASTDLQKIGLGLDVLTVQKIADEQGYIDALGRKRTAEILRDATIGEAQAQRQAVIEASTAEREAKETENENLAMVAAAEKERDVKKAKYLAEIEAEKARANQAGPLSEAQARQQVVQQEVEIERLRTIKQTEVAEAEAVRKEKELMATVIKPAEAQQRARILEAEAERESQIILAEAHRQQLEREGQGQAEAVRLKQLAEAEGMKAKLLAEAEGIKAKLLAEAEGTRQKVLAFADLDDSAKLLMILDEYPHILEALSPLASAIAEPIGNIDRLVVLDSGNNGHQGVDGAISRLTNMVPGTVNQLFEVSKSLGLDIEGLLNKLGIQAEQDEALSPLTQASNGQAASSTQPGEVQEDQAT